MINFHENEIRVFNAWTHRLREIICLSIKSPLSAIRIGEISWFGLKSTEWEQHRDVTSKCVLHRRLAHWVRSVNGSHRIIWHLILTVNDEFNAEKVHTKIQKRTDVRNSMPNKTIEMNPKWGSYWHISLSQQIALFTLSRHSICFNSVVSYLLVNSGNVINVQLPMCANKFNICKLAMLFKHTVALEILLWDILAIKWNHQPKASGYIVMLMILCQSLLFGVKVEWLYHRDATGTSFRIGLPLQPLYTRLFYQ